MITKEYLHAVLEMELRGPEPPNKTRKCIAPLRRELPQQYAASHVRQKLQRTQDEVVCRGVNPSK